MSHIHLTDDHHVVNFRAGGVVYEKVKMSHEVVRYMEEAHTAGQLLNNDDIKLQVINKLLYEERKKAVDEEQTGAQFYGASIIKTKSGEWFITHNDYLGGESINRRCAESNGVEEASQNLNDGETLEIADLWFVGGKGNKQEGQWLLPEEVGRIYSPCGHCLQMISNKQMKADGETKVHMIPANNADILLSYAPADVTLENRKDGQVITRTIEQLLPQAKPLLNDNDGKTKAAILKSWEMLSDKKHLHGLTDLQIAQALEKMHLFSVSNVEGNLGKIHKLMWEKAQGLVNLYKGTAKHFSLAVARTTDNQYYLGVQVVGDKIQSTPSALLDVIENAIGSVNAVKDKSILEGRKFTDVFLMDIDVAEMQALEHAAKDEKIPLTPPSGDALDRLYKRRPLEKAKGIFRNEMEENEAPKIHFLLPTLPIEFERKKHCVSMDIKDFMPMPFSSPKTHTSAEHDKASKVVKTKDLDVEGPNRIQQQLH